MDFTVAYTFAKSEDDNSSDSGVPTLINQGASAAPGFQGGGPDNWIPRPRRSDLGRSSFDLRHHLTVSHVIELPVGRGWWRLGHASGFVNALVGNWSLAGVAVLRSGELFNVTCGIDYNDDGDALNDRPALVSGSLNDLYARGSLGRTQYLIPVPDVLTRLNTPGNVTDVFAQIPRNALRAPSVRCYDVSLSQRFQLTEAVALGFESNFFNLFNRTNFAGPVAVLTNSRFGRVTNTLAGTNPRQIQLGLKLTF